jgi:hypothetical protein
MSSTNSLNQVPVAASATQIVGARAGLRWAIEFTDQSGILKSQIDGSSQFSRNNPIKKSCP